MGRDRSVAVGIEIAGGHATVALVDRFGRIRHRCQAKTLRGRPASATLEPYFRALDQVLAQARAERLLVYGIGISVPGSLDYTCRCPKIIPSLPALNGFPLCDVLEARYHLPTHLLVDVDAAALGEYHVGAGKGLKRLLYLTVNAVVGASLVIDGQLEVSPQSYTGHVCHMSISTSPSGSRCSCGKRGCINTLVSIEAMQKMVQRALRRGEESSLTQRLLNREYFSPSLLAEEATRGDTVALQVYEEMGRSLSAAVTQYISLFAPNVLIFGGDILCTSELLLTRTRNALMTNTSSRVCSLVEVVPACLGKDAALVGVTMPFTCS